MTMSLLNLHPSRLFYLPQHQDNFHRNRLGITLWVLYKKQEPAILRENGIHPPFLCAVLLNFLG